MARMDDDAAEYSQPLDKGDDEIGRQLHAAMDGVTLSLTLEINEWATILIAMLYLRTGEKMNDEAMRSLADIYDKIKAPVDVAVDGVIDRYRDAV